MLKYVGKFSSNSIGFLSSAPLEMPTTRSLLRIRPAAGEPGGLVQLEGLKNVQLVVGPGISSKYQRYHFILVSNIFYFHPDPWGKDSQFDEHIFQRGWFNHQTRYHFIWFQRL